MGQSCDCGMATPSLTWCPIFLREKGSISSLSLLSGISSKVPPFISGAFWRVPLTSYFLRLPVSILSVGPQCFSPYTSLNTWSGSPFPPTPPHLLSLPGPSLSPHLWLLSSLSQWDWGNLTCALQLVDLFGFCGLYLGYSVLFWANMHLLVSKYHA